MCVYIYVQTYVYTYMDKQDYIVEWKTNANWHTSQIVRGLRIENLGVYRDAGNTTGNYLVGFRV